MASIDWQFHRNAMVYVRVARGFKSGGFNGRANSVAERTQYEPETVTSYEAGVRSTIGGQLRLNVDRLLQRLQEFPGARRRAPAPIRSPACPRRSSAVINAGALHIAGAEIEAAWTPVPGLLLDTQIGYLDAEYDVFADARFPGGSRAFQTPGLRAATGPGGSAPSMRSTSAPPAS